MSAKTKLVAGLAAASLTLVGCGKIENAGPIHSTGNTTVDPTKIINTQQIENRYDGNGFDIKMYVVQATPDKYCIITSAGTNTGGVAQNCYDGTPTRPGAASGAALATPER